MANKRDLIVAAARAKLPSAMADAPLCGYIMGATGWICTQARIDAQAAHYPAYADMIRKYGPKWLGKRCYDCAQWVRAVVKAAGYSLVSGATSQWKQDIWEAKGTMDSLPDDLRAIVIWRFSDATGKMEHVAIILEGGTESEARGHAYGVREYLLAGRTFNRWGRLRGLDQPYEGGTIVTETPDNATETENPTLQKGAKGDAVVTLQQRLMAHGIQLPKYGADGDFGKETLVAVKQFQGLHGLKVDGVVGAATWSALLKDEEINTALEYTVQASDLSEAEAKALLAELKNRFPNVTMEQEQ